MSKTFVYDRFDVFSDEVFENTVSVPNNDGDWIKAEDAINREAVLQAEIRTLQVQLNEAKAPQWISVDERLPTEETEVLVTGWQWNIPARGRYQVIGVLMDGLWGEPGRLPDEELHPPTHWQPLPAAPKEPA
jgi:hypothetical protein